MAEKIIERGSSEWLELLAESKVLRAVALVFMNRQERVRLADLIAQKERGESRPTPSGPSK